MPTCRDCGEEIVFEKRNGKWHPCDPERASHYRNRKHIDAVKGRTRTPKALGTGPRRSNQDNEVFDMLTAQWDAKRARQLLPLVTGKTLEEKLKSALKIVARRVDE